MSSSPSASLWGTSPSGEGSFRERSKRLALTDPSLHTTIVEERMRPALELLRGQPEIRVAIQPSDNMGHYASSVLVIERLVRWGVRRITAFYGESRELEQRGQKRAWEKLRLLVPGMPEQPRDALAETTIQIGQVTLVLSPRFTEGQTDHWKSRPLDEALLCLTGGWDGDAGGLTAYLNVRFFCCLQPYRWTGVSPSRAVNCIYSVPSKMAPFEVTPDLVITLPFPSQLCIDDLAYHVPSALTLDTFPAFKLANQASAACCERLVDLATRGQIDLLPIYFSLGRSQYAFHDIFFNLTMALLCYRNALVQSSKPIVLAMLGSAAPDQYAELVEMFAGRACFMGGRRVAVSQFASLAGLLTALRDDLSRVAVLARPDESRLQSSLQAGAHVVVLGLGNVPNSMFRSLFRAATLVRVFEGMGSCSLALNVGGPFLRIPSTDDQIEDVVSMFQLPSGAKDGPSPGFAQYCMGRTQALGATAALWDDLLGLVRGKQLSREVLPHFVLGQFLECAADRESALFGDFAALGAYHRSELNDKLWRALAYLASGSASSPSSDQIAAQELVVHIERFDAAIRVRGLRRAPVQGGGDCWYASVLTHLTPEQLGLAVGSGGAVGALRNALADFVHAQWAGALANYITDDMNRDTVVANIRRMGNDTHDLHGQMAEVTQAFLSARGIHRNIRLYRHHSGAIQTRNLGNSDHAEVAIAHLGNPAEGHFDPLIPRT